MRKETPILLGPLERANLNHWTIHVSITAGDNKKICNKICDKACPDLKLR
jgi:hypothetical protein